MREHAQKGRLSKKFRTGRTARETNGRVGQMASEQRVHSTHGKLNRSSWLSTAHLARVSVHANQYLHQSSAAVINEIPSQPSLSRRRAICWFDSIALTVTIKPARNRKLPFYLRVCIVCACSNNCYSAGNITSVRELSHNSQTRPPRFLGCNSAKISAAE